MDMFYLIYFNRVNNYRNSTKLKFPLGVKNRIYYFDNNQMI